MVLESLAFWSVERGFIVVGLQSHKRTSALFVERSTLRVEGDGKGENLFTGTCVDWLP